VPRVTSNAPFTRIATFHARRGQGDRVVERLQHAAELLAEASGCELWLVHRDHEDPHAVRVSELWSTREQRDAAQTLPAVSENAAGVMALLDGPPEGQLGAAGRNPGWAHRHRVAEEIYGWIKVDDKRFELEPLAAVRVAPGSARELAADEDGLEVLAFGLHSPGDGEMVSDWSPA
jgi:quinol monooxygenase YgiN